MIENTFKKDVQLLVYKPDGSITKLSYWMNVLPLRFRAILPEFFTGNYPAVLVISHINSEGGHTLISCISTSDTASTLPQFIENIDDIDGCYLSYYYEPSELVRKTVVEDISNEFDIPCHIV